jgi:prepilin-type N-terminal cleavage/methylation domain-containing protein
MTTNQSFSLTPRFSEVGPVADRLRTVPTISPASAAAKSCRAFTFIELLIVVAVLALMVCLLATARAGSRPNSQGAVCLNNLKQLMAVFTMYTHDYNEFFPPNPDTVTHVQGGNWVADDESGWMPVGNIGAVDAGNPHLLTDPTWNPFAPYIRTNISLYRCPFDPRIVTYTGSDSNQWGQKIPAIRSVSMNGGVGTKGTAAGGGNASVDGSWLNGSHSHTANNPYATFGKWSDFKAARPSDIWALVDDDPWTINDGTMAVIAASPDSVDYLSVFNDNSTSFAFADGHGETHKWKSSIWMHNGPPSRSTFDAAAAAGLGKQDWFWWASHATRSTVTGTVP